MRSLSDWLYSPARPLSFPVWLLRGDRVEIDGNWYSFSRWIGRIRDQSSLAKALGVDCPHDYPPRFENARKRKERQLHYG